MEVSAFFTGWQKPHPFFISFSLVLTPEMSFPLQDKAFQKKWANGTAIANMDAKISSKRF